MGLMSQPLPRLGFLGVSASGCCALAELSSGDIATPTLLWDISAEALTRGLALVPDATLVATPVDLLEADIEGVVIAMPNPLHAGLAMAALNRGLAVFCEAPLGRNAIEVARVVSPARATPLRRAYARDSRRSRGGTDRSRDGGGHPHCLFVAHGAG